MITVSQIRLPLSASKNDAINIALRTLRVPKAQVAAAEISKISVDARRTPPSLVYTVGVKLHDKGAEQAYAGCAPCVTVAQPQPFVITPNFSQKKLDNRPVVCGFGPAGIFCALTLAKAGYNPIVLERGSSMEKRVEKVASFENGGKLNCQTNIQFGEGGAGTFSDGKLTTRINNPLCGFVTQTLLQHGAPEEIAMQQKPHIGTDALRNVIVSIRNEIIALGGEIRFDTQLTGIKTQNGKITAVETQNGDIECSVLVLAIGHSSRDTFEMLNDTQINLKAKAFSVGFRAEHLQQNIEKSLYHSAQGHPALPRGEYQLSQHVGSRCVYTFCMCPGGSVVAAASEEETALTNGMSYHARDGKNANSAVVVSVSEADFNGDAMAAIAFQRELEKKAFMAGGGNYCAPAQTVQSFLKGEASLKIGEVSPTYPRGVKECDLGQLLPNELTSALKIGLSSFEGKLKGFTSSDCIITGLETRTSSPVRLPRNEAGESLDIIGIYPCGEGAGYAGGIMSAAVDGLKTASSITQQYAPK